MSRQQKRAVEREEEKSKTRKAPAAKKPDTTPVVLDVVKRLKAEDLSDREVRGEFLARAVKKEESLRVFINENHVLYRGKKDRVHDVKRRDRNNRGTLEIFYECGCPDYEKEGRNGCMHTVAERIVRGEIVVIGDVSSARARAAHARRGPVRKRHGHDGRSIRTVQSAARTGLSAELPRLISSLVKSWEKRQREERVLERHENVIVLNHRPPTDAIVRAAALLYKIAFRKSAEAMKAEYAALIDAGLLRLDAPPHRNTLTDWMNDATLTSILQEFIATTAYPFHRREIGAMIDSSKVSQMRTAHHRRVAYDGDERPGADWMRCHALVGVETLVCMAVQFGGNRGLGITHDSIFLQPLVSEAIKQFRLHYLLADKAYFGREKIEWLWDVAGIRAVIPVKKNIEREGKRRKEIFDPYWDLIRWYDDHQREFHAIYRLRPKIEGFFSLLKRLAEESMWSRGRLQHNDDGTRTYEPMKDGPCTAWANEALCKFIYMNLRATNLLQEETGVEIDYLIPDRCFAPPAEPLLRAA